MGAGVYLGYARVSQRCPRRYRQGVDYASFGSKNQQIDVDYPDHVLATNVVDGDDAGD